MGRRKVLSRTESQALTREEILDAAEKIFLANGYHSTSLNTIAAEAGRTVGAIYSNYASKEDLCLEVLERRGSVVLTELMSALLVADDSDDARLNVMAAKWAGLCADRGMVMLAAEYGVTTARDPVQRARTVEYVVRARASVRVLIEDQVPSDLGRSAQTAFDQGVEVILATGLGLAQLQTLGVISIEDSTRTLVEAVRVWLGQVRDRLAVR